MKKSIEKMFDLTGRTAIITGGTGLLGTVYVAVLLEAGATVAAIDKSPGEIEGFFRKLKNEYGLNDEELARLKVFTCDITNKEQVTATFLEIEKHFKTINILINNASLVKQVGQDPLDDEYKPFLETNPADWEAYFQVDLTGAILMSQQAICYMQKSGGGVIVNISSTYGILSPDQRLYECFTAELPEEKRNQGLRIEKPIGYSVSKSGVLNLTRHLATQFAKYNIRVNTLTPGGVFANNPPQFVDSYASRTPLQRMANKEEYRGPILFLVSDASSYMTGANLIVDGGWSAW